MAWADGSNSRAKSSGVRPARTRSTICCLNTAGYGGLVLGIVDTSSSQEDQVSTKLGQLQLLTRVAKEKALPFAPLVPNAVTIEAMKEARQGNLPQFASVEDLLDDLHADD